MFVQVHALSLGDKNAEKVKNNNVLVPTKNAAVAVVGLGFAEEALENPLDGFGFLVPAIEERELLGCLWSSSIFPSARAPQGHRMLRVMVGGARSPELALRDDDALIASVINELSSILGVRSSPVCTRVVRWTDAIPQYNIGHLERVAKMEQVASRWPGLHFSGNAYRGVAVNDCTREAQRIARVILEVDHTNHGEY